MIAIKDEYQGQGVGSKMVAAILDLADNWLNLRRVDLTVFTDNESAIHLYKKYGFNIEGELKDFAFRNGEYISAYQMGRIKESA
jgi:putative acetyltransferase